MLAFVKPTISQQKKASKSFSEASIRLLRSNSGDLVYATKFVPGNRFRRTSETFSSTLALREAIILFAVVSHLVIYGIYTQQEDYHYLKIFASCCIAVLDFGLVAGELCGLAIRVDLERHFAPSEGLCTTLDWLGCLTQITQIHRMNMQGGRNLTV